MQIFKLLPRTNCKECGSPSCLAFAMKVAAGKADYRSCPYITEESLKSLNEMMEPPVKKVVINRGEREIILGDEKVLFRHDETFYNPTALGVEIPPMLDEEHLEKMVKLIESFTINRAGQNLHLDLVATSESCEESSTVAKYFSNIHEVSTFPLLLRFTKPETLKMFSEMVNDQNIVLFPDFKSDLNEDILNLLSERGCPVALPCRKLKDVEISAGLFEKYKIKMGIIALTSGNSAERLDILTSMRKGAITDGNRNLGYPALIWSNNEETETGEIATAIMKYGSVCIFRSTDSCKWLPYLTLRQNIFTDPRRPIQVEAKVYEFGNVNSSSPVLITTNFSLTYFTVAQEIEASRIPAYLLIVDTEGTSVLTAWSSDRFNAKKILDSLERENIKNLITHNRLIIPGYVSPLKGDLEEISSWDILVGPREAVDLPKFLRNMEKTGKSMYVSS